MEDRDENPGVDARKQSGMSLLKSLSKVTADRHIAIAGTQQSNLQSQIMLRICNAKFKERSGKPQIVAHLKGRHTPIFSGRQPCARSRGLSGHGE